MIYVVRLRLALQIEGRACPFMMDSLFATEVSWWCRGRTTPFGKKWAKEVAKVVLKIERTKTIETFLEQNTRTTKAQCLVFV